MYYFRGGQKAWSNWVRPRGVFAQDCEMPASESVEASGGEMEAGGAPAAKVSDRGATLQYCNSVLKQCNTIGGASSEKPPPPPPFEASPHNSRFLNYLLHFWFLRFKSPLVNFASVECMI